jgi:hypothetical protein
MTIKIGDTLPEGTLAEFIETETEGCALGPNTFKVPTWSRARRSRSSACQAPTPRPARPSTCQATSPTPMPEGKGRRRNLVHLGQ